MLSLINMARTKHHLRLDCGGWVKIWHAFEDSVERWRQRRLLLALDDRMLKDIGLSRCDAEREAAKRWRR